MSGLAFTYVVDGPRLQAQALILAASLRRHHPDAFQFAACPKAGLSSLPGFVRDALNRLDVILSPLDVPSGIWAQAYPHGNKILALAQDRPGMAHSVFLDTDMVMLAPLQAQDLPAAMEVSVIPEGIRGWGKDEARWEQAYAFMGLPMPEERIQLLRGRRSLSPPYFNGGFVAINETGRVEGQNFGTLWLRTASHFDHAAPIGGKRPWLDQITLPLTMARYGFSRRIIDETNNCSISNGRDLGGLETARIIHYHRSAFLRAWPGSDALVDAAVTTATGKNRDAVARLLTEGGYLGPIQHTTPSSAET